MTYLQRTSREMLAKVYPVPGNVTRIRRITKSKAV
jgi:hypothetical protein